MIIAGIFFLGFVLGILFVNLWGNTYLKENQILNENTLLSIRNTEIDQRALFLHVLASRGKVFLLLGLTGYTVAGIPVMAAFLGWLGFSTGVFLSIFIIRMHLMGILLFLSSVLPQIFFYAPLVWMMSVSVMERGIRRFRSRQVFDVWAGEKSYMQVMGLCLALLIVGTLLESCVSPWLLKQVVNYFF